MAKKKEIIPKKPWQGSQILELRLRVPTDVVMLCKLMNTNPDNLLTGFLSCLAVERNDKNPDAAKQDCIDFFIHYGFGKDFYSEQEIRAMFTELRQVNDLWPNGPTSLKFIDQHSYWRRRYWKYWFKKWYWKIRRRKVHQ